MVRQRIPHQPCPRIRATGQSVCCYKTLVGSASASHSALLLMEVVVWPEASRQAGRIEGMPAPMVGPRAPVSASQAPVVLVAEDTPDLQDLLMEVLISEGY